MEIHGALSNRVAPELGIFGVAPGAFSTTNPLCSRRELVDAEVHQLRCRYIGRSETAATGAHQKPAPLLVVEQRAPLRLVVGGIAHVVLGDSQVVVEEETHLPRLVVLVVDGNPSQIQVLVKVHGVIADQA